MKQHTLSRTAARLYWLARYLERAESTARLINVNANLLIDLPVRLTLGWQPLIDIMGTRALFDEHYAEPNERNVVRFLASDTRNPGAILTSLDRARENARTVRETMPRVAFEFINGLFLFAREELSGSPLSRSRRREVMDGIMHRTQHIDGFLSGNMVHDANWNFLRLGQHIERADMTTRIIDVRSADLLAEDLALAPFQHIQWRSVLRSLHAMQSYHAHVQEPVEQSLVLEFLFKSTNLPRSLVRCLRSIRVNLRDLPRHDRPLRSCNRARRFVELHEVRDLDGASLHAFIDDCQLAIGDLNDAIDKTYFHARLTRRR